MKRTAILACLAACATMSASAISWFNGGIADGWPTAATMSGGSWTACSEATLIGNYIEIDTSSSGEVSFDVGESAKQIDIQIPTITAKIQFTEVPLSKLGTPADAKGGLTVVTNTVDGGALYYAGYSVDPDNTETNGWVKLSGAIPDLSSEVDVRVDYKYNADDDDCFVRYQVKVGEEWVSLRDTENEEWLGILFDYTNPISTVAFKGSGNVSELIGEYRNADGCDVTVKLETVANSHIQSLQYSLTADGEYVDYPASGINPIEVGATLYVKGVCDAGYEFSTSFVIDGNIDYVAEPAQMGPAVATKLFPIANRDEDGTAEKPYTLTSASDLATFALAFSNGTLEMNKNYKLACDGDTIDMSESASWVGIGSEEKPFTGTFDGNGKTIASLKFANATYAGLFGCVSNATIKSVTVNVNGFDDTYEKALEASEYGIGGAAIVGEAFGTSVIQGCTASGTIYGTHNVAGIVVQVGALATIKDCTNNASLKSCYTKVAGIVAYNQNETGTTLIEGCVNNGTVTGSAPASARYNGSVAGISKKDPGYDGVAGIIGWVGADLKIKDCANNGELVTVGTDDEQAKMSVGSMIGKTGYAITLEGTNTMLDDYKSVGSGSLLAAAFASVNDGIATLVDSTALANGGNFKVMCAGGSVDSVTFGAALDDTLVIDQTLATCAIETVTTGVENAMVDKTSVDKIDTYTVVAAGAKIGDKYYATLADAYTAATDGDKIEVLANVTLAETLVVDKTITIDFGGKVVTLPAAYVDGIKVTAAATIKNGTLNSQLAAFADSPNARAYALHSYKTDATYENLTINGANYRFVVYAEGADTVAECYDNGEPTTTVNCYNVDVNGNGVLFEAEFTKMNLDADCEGIASGTAAGSYKAAIYSAGNATVTIAGGIYTHEKALLSGNLGGEIIVNGGTFNGKIYSWMQSTAHSAYNDTASYKAYFTLNAGTFNGAVEFKEDSDAARALDVFAKDDSAVVTALTLPTGFGWDADGKLIKGVAAIGSVRYATLADAVAAATDGQTVTLLADVTDGCGIKVAQDKFATGLTIDFGGFTYTATKDPTGSNGTENQVFQLLKGNKVTFKNGKIEVASASASLFRFVIQNYSSLTLTDMTIDGTNLGKPNKTPYTISNCYGTTTFGEGTTITAAANGFAFDIDNGGNTAAYPDGAIVKVNGATINGKIGLGRDGALTLTGGTFTGATLVNDTTGDIVVDVTKDASVTLAAPEGYEWNSDGKLVVQSAAPTPADGSETKVDPVEGQENTYEVKPTGDKTTVAVDNVKAGDTLVIDATVTEIGVNGGASAGATIKVMNSDSVNPAQIPNDAMVGWDGNTFNAALKADAVVDGIPVTPTVKDEVTIGSEVVKPFDGSDTVAVKAIPGLRYQLIAGDTPDAISTAASDIQTATAAGVKLINTKFTPAGAKAFYKVQVTK